MDKLLKAASSVAEQVFNEHAQRGGTVRDGERVLSVAEAASFKGALTPILWMLREFIVEYEIDFPTPIYKADPDALLGVSVEALEVSRSASPSVFMLADFLRNEIVPQDTLDLDLSMLFSNFREWAAKHVLSARSVRPPQGEQEPE